MPGIPASATWPTARKDAAEARYAQQHKHWRPAGVIRGVGNQLEVYADASGPLNVKLKTGEITMDGFHAVQDTPLTFHLAAADASNDRLDAVVARLLRTPPYTIEFDVKTGSPSLTPAVPTLTADELLLGVAEIGATETNLDADKVTDYRRWAPVPGHWQDWSPATTREAGSSSNLTVDPNVGFSRCKFEGDTVWLRYARLWRFQGTPDTQAVHLSLPATPSQLEWGGYGTVQNVLASVVCADPEVISIRRDPVSNSGFWTTGVSYTWARFTAMYEIGAV
jgi:hypothetical protein